MISPEQSYYSYLEIVSGNQPGWYENYREEDLCAISKRFKRHSVAIQGADVGWILIWWMFFKMKMMAEPPCLAHYCLFFFEFFPSSLLFLWFLLFTVCTCWVGPPCFLTASLFVSLFLGNFLNFIFQLSVHLTTSAIIFYFPRALFCFLLISGYMNCNFQWTVPSLNKCSFS